MKLQSQIESLVKSELEPVHFELVNESFKHAHGGEESHFKLLVVSEKFEGMSRIARQRWVYEILDSVIKQGIHALAQKTMTPKEWDETPAEFKTPNCQGG